MDDVLQIDTCCRSHLCQPLVSSLFLLLLVGDVCICYFAKACDCLLHVTGSSVQHQDFATFIAKAQAASTAVSSTLSVLSALQPELPQPVSILTAGGHAVQYAPNPRAFVMPPAVTKAVLTQAEAQQALAWQSSTAQEVCADPSATVLTCPMRQGCFV